jgi:hypothetical protein
MTERTDQKRCFAGSSLVCHQQGTGFTRSLLAVRVACPFLDNFLGGLPAAAVGPALRGGAIVLGLFLVVNVFILSRCFRGSFRCCRPGGRLLVAPVGVPATAMMTGMVSPVIPPLPGVLALRGPGLLPCLLWRCLRRLLPGILWLRIFFCHNCQTD